MGQPKITYNDGSARTLLFTYPSVKKPGVAIPLEADREDSITTSGKKQSVTWNTAEFRTLQMDWVPASDIAAWQLFMRYAVKGGTFRYFPDRDVPGTYVDYTLEDTGWSPQYAEKSSAGTFIKFSLKLRTLV
jgi:hypothetical protein